MNTNDTTAPSDPTAVKKAEREIRLSELIRIRMLWAKAQKDLSVLGEALAHLCGAQAERIYVSPQVYESIVGRPIKKRPLMPLHFGETILLADEDFPEGIIGVLVPSQRPSGLHSLKILRISQDPEDETEHN